MIRMLALCLLLLPASLSAQSRTPLLMEGKQTLYQRVITRIGATLSPLPGGTGPVVPGFSVFYVYSRQGEALEVGRASDGHVEGWIPAAKAIDWKHAMIATFATRAGREPGLFLQSERDERLLMLDADAGGKAQAMRQAARAGNPGPVLALEPDAQVDFQHRPYLMPILNAQRVERESGPPLRLLEVLSAPSEPPPAPPPPATQYKAGVVFLIDTTLSMQPYIDRTRVAIRDVMARIANSPVRDNFRFGLVAYRDSLEDNPGLEYAAKIFAQPRFDQLPDLVNLAIAQVGQSPVSSTGFDEDPIGGLKTAIDDIDWAALGGRYIILITDAGARPSTHPHSVTHMNIAEIRELAKSRGIAIFAIHLLTPEGAANHDHERARAQYEELTQFNGAGPLYFPVAGGSPDNFSRVVVDLTTALLQQVGDAAGHPVAPGSRAPNAETQNRVSVVGEAMRLAYVGRQENTQAPDVVRSFTVDRDLADASVASLDVRVLLTRNQLSDLARSLRTILDAGLAGRTEPANFFTQLRAAFAAAARDPSRIASAQRIGGLLGEYLDDLPYQSEIMDLSEQDWLAMGAIAQRTVLNNIEAKLRLYQEFEAHPDQWVDLFGTRSPGEAIYPVPIEALP